MTVAAGLPSPLAAAMFAMWLRFLKCTAKLSRVSPGPRLSECGALVSGLEEQGSGEGSKGKTYRVDQDKRGT